MTKTRLAYAAVTGALMSLAVSGVAFATHPYHATEDAMSGVATDLAGSLTTIALAAAAAVVGIFLITVGLRKVFSFFRRA